ncbi:MAG: Bug family tripartite tricarboxylate transporter substrate binding protein [Burkholderiales bacterium]
MRPVTIVVLAVLGAALIQHAAAQTPGSYPNRPIRLILPAAPGGPVDVIGRTVGIGLAEALGQLIVMDNRAGAGGIIGAEIVARGNPDGYTLMFAHSGPLAIEAAIHVKLSYHPLKDFAPVSLVAASPYALIVSPASPAKSVKELVALAKSRPEKFHFASGGIGTGLHMAGELLNLAAGIRMIHVPYKGAAPGMTALMSGEVDTMFNGVSSALPQVKAGRLRALAVSSAQRTPLLPDLPTVAESGLKYETAGWYGLVAPARTPKAVTARLQSQLHKALNTPEMKERLASQGVDGIASTSEQLTQHLRVEIDKWTAVVKAAGLKAD